MSFSKIKSFKNALQSLNVKEDVQSERYKFSVLEETQEIIEFAKEVFRLFQRKLKLFENIQYTNEADRERLVDFMLSEVVLFILEKHNKNLKIGSKKTLIGLNSYGFLDLCIYLEEGLNTEKILTVIEVKEKDVDRGLGQLLMEIEAVYRKTNVLTYGIVTTFEDWHLISYEEKDTFPRIRRFNKITFENVSRPDFDTFKKILLTIMDILKTHSLISNSTTIK